MSDTPETDTKQHFMYMDVVECVEIDFARKLERERDRNKAELEKLAAALHAISRMDTSQDASPQQCGAVIIAMDALGI